MNKLSNKYIEYLLFLVDEIKYEYIENIKMENVHDDFYKNIVKEALKRGLFVHSWMIDSD